MRLVFIFCFSIFATVALSQNSFTALKGIPGGRIRTLVAGNNKMFAVSTHEPRVYVTFDKGETWQPFGPSTITANSVLVDGNSIYLSDYSNFYVSNDQGATWTRRNSQVTFQQGLYLDKLSVEGDVFVAYGCEGVYVSPDGGVTWTKISTDRVCHLGEYRVATTSNGDVYFTSPDHGLWRHAFPTDGVWDSGKSIEVHPKQAAGNDYAVSVGVSSSDRIFLTGIDNIGNPFMKSSFSGDIGSWNNVNLPAANHGLTDPVWANHPTTGKLFFVNNSDLTLWELNDEANGTWIPKEFPSINYTQTGVLALAWDDELNMFAGNNGAGVFLSTSAGATWTIANGSGSDILSSPYASDIEVLSSGMIIVKDDHSSKGLWAASADEETFTWRPQPFFFYGARWGQKLTALQDNSLVASTSVGTCRSVDGLNWTVQNGTGYQVYIPVPGSTEIYGLQHDGTAAVSADNCVSWNPITVNGLPSSMNIMYGTRSNNNAIYLAVHNNSNGRTEYWKINTGVSPWQATIMSTPLRKDGFSCAGLFVINNKVYAGDNQRMAFSSDGGVTWKTVVYNHQKLTLVSDGVSNAVAMSTRGALLLTQDDGKTWRTIAMPSPYAYVMDICKMPGANKFYAASQSGPISVFDENLIIPSEALPPYVNVGWQSVAGGAFGGEMIKVARSASGRFFAQGILGLFRLNAAGTKWEHISAPQLTWGIKDFIIDTSNKVYAVHNGQVAYSTDAGATWTMSTTNMPELYKLGLSNNGNVIAVGPAGIFTSTNGGATFTQRYASGPGQIFRSVATSSTGAMLAIMDGSAGVMKSTDGGLSWTLLTTLSLQSGEEILSVQALESNAMAIVTSKNILKTTDDGATWNSITGNITETTTNVWLKNNAQVLIGPGGDYYFTNQFRIFKSVNNGVSWQEVEEIRANHIFFSGSDMYVAVSPDGTSTGGIMKSTDGGATFSQMIAGLVSWWGDGMAFSQGNINYVAGFGRYYLSSDDGATFTYPNTNMYPDRLLKVSDEKLIAYGGGIGVSTDGGATWTNTGYQGNYINMITTRDGSVYYGVRDNNKIITSTDLITWTEMETTGFPTINVESMVVSESGTIYVSGYNSTLGQLALYKIEFGAVTRIETLITPRSLNYARKVFAQGDTEEDLKLKTVVYDEFGAIYIIKDDAAWVRNSAPPAAQKLIVSNTGEGDYFFLTSKNTGDLWISRDLGSSWQNISGFGRDMVQNIVINPITGYAYAAVENNPIQKSSLQVIPNYGTPPEVLSKVPEHNSTNVKREAFSLVLNFKKTVKGIAGKKIRLFESTQTTTAVETFDAAAGVFSEVNKQVTFDVDDSKLVFGKIYFVIVENGAFTDIFGNAFAGYTNSTQWSFTLENEPDTEGPQFGDFISSNLDLSVAQSITFEIGVTDIALNPNQVYVKYRHLSSKSTSDWETVTMTQTGDKFKTPVIEKTAYGGAGLEFYFEAIDNNDNTGRSPSTDNTFHYSYLKFPTSGESGDIPKISVGSGTDATAFKIIAIPYNVTDNKIATLFNEKADNSTWKIGTYDGTSKYLEYPGTLSTITRGVGYWFLQTGANDIRIENIEILQENRSNPFQLTLKPGWNQIGNPYPFKVDWNEVIAANPGVTLSPLKVYVNSYSNGQTLEAFQGGWVKNLGSANINLTFPIGGGNSNGRASTISSDLAGDNWELPLVLEQGLRTNNMNGIGMNADALVGADQLDDFSPPAFLERFEVQFDDLAENVSKNIVPLTANHEWRFTAYTINEGNAQLKWDNQNLGANSKELYLLDEEAQILVNMREENVYSFKGQPQTNFILYFGENLLSKIKPVKNVLGEPYPNPSSGTTVIPYTIADNASKGRVEIEVYNLQGSKMATLKSGTAQGGFHQEEWRHATAGIYFVKLTGVDNHGKSFTQTRKITIK